MDRQVPFDLSIRNNQDGTVLWKVLSFFQLVNTRLKDRAAPTGHFYPASHFLRCQIAHIISLCITEDDSCFGDILRIGITGNSPQRNTNILGGH